MESKILQIYTDMNDSERFGLQFGMFPARLMGMSREESISLMQYGKQNKYK